MNDSNADAFLSDHFREAESIVADLAEVVVCIERRDDRSCTVPGHDLATMRYNILRVLGYKILHRRLDGLDTSGFPVAALGASCQTPPSRLMNAGGVQRGSNIVRCWDTCAQARHFPALKTGWPSPGLRYRIITFPTLLQSITVLHSRRNSSKEFTLPCKL